MDILALITVFGDGIIGAHMGALPAFIVTGIHALVDGALTATDVGDDVAVNYLAFGSSVDPHIAFIGSVTAVGYAGHKGKLAFGTDILSPLNGLGEPGVFPMGGIFDVLGLPIHYRIGLLPIIGSTGPAITDLLGIIALALAVVTRLALGRIGLTGKYIGPGKCEWFATRKGFVYNVVLGGDIGIVMSFTATFLYGNEFTAASNILPVVCFGFAAIVLILIQTGFATPATHYIFLPSGLTAVVGITAQDPAGALLGILFGTLDSLPGDLVSKSSNSHCNTYINPLIITIPTLTIVINVANSVIDV